MTERELTAFFEDLHRHPELALEEVRTTTLLRKALTEAGIAVYPSGLPTGLIAVIEGALQGRVIGLRADMDALPVQEESGLSYASEEPGKMHACGHDFHTACMLGAALLLKEREASLPGAVKVVFQPAEEIDDGAKLVVATGLLDDVQAVWPVLLRREEDVAIDQQADGIVQAAVLVEVGTDGDHLDVLRVVADDFHLAAVRKGHDEGRVAALMGLQERAVQVHFRRLGRALEEQEGVLPGGEGDFPAVMGLAAVILLRGAVQGVVGMGNRDGFPLVPVLGELPVCQVGFGCHAAGGEEGKGHEARKQVFHRLIPCDRL